MPRAALYLRLSSVADDSTSIVRQERDLREHAARKGWDVTAVLVDEGISGRKARAKAEEAVRMLADDEADVLAVHKLDRFTRQGWDGLGGVSRALEARERAGRPALFVALLDGLESSQPAFRLIAGVLSEVARTEADNGATRARNAVHYRRTVTNRYTGGSTVPYGYRSAPAPDGVGRVLVIDPAEAEIVREVAGRIIDGEAVAAIGRDLHARGVPASRSAVRRASRLGQDPTGLGAGTWNPTTIAQLWTGDSFLGRVRHRGDLVRDEDGLPRAAWPPILDRDTVDRVRARLRPPGRPAATPRRRQARLLSGLAYCGECGAKLYVTTSSGRPIYRCPMLWGRECPRPHADAHSLEEHVSATFLRVAGAAPERVMEPVPATADEAALREILAAQRETTERMMETGADIPALAGRLQVLKSREAEIQAAPPAEPRMIATGRTLAEAWAADLGVAEKRSLLLSAMDHLMLSRAVRRGEFDAERVRIAWLS